MRTLAHGSRPPRLLLRAVWNHADTDAGYNLPSFWERLTVGRDYVYDSTTSRLHSSGVSSAGVCTRPWPCCSASEHLLPTRLPRAGLRRLQRR